MGALAIARGLPELRPVAGLYFVSEAVIFEVTKEDWARAYDFLVDMMSSFTSDFFAVRLDERFGVLAFVIVPLTEAAAEEAAGEIEKDARWRSGESPP